MSETIKYPVTPEAAGWNNVPKPYSLATQVGNLLFVSGQAATDENGNIVAGTFEEEFRLTMENLRRVLEAAGTDFSKVVQVRSYIRDSANGALYNELYREYFPEPRPARTTLRNCLPETLQFEIESIALVD